MPVSKKSKSTRGSTTTKRKTARSKAALRSKGRTTRATGKAAKRKTAKGKTAKVKATKAKKTVRSTSAASKKKKNAIKIAYTKSKLLKEVAEATELTKKDVSRVFEELAFIADRHFKRGGAGHFTIPGFVKCVVKNKPATKARKGINPFTGEETVFKAKPARKVIKVRALKKLKEMVD